MVGTSSVSKFVPKVCRAIKDEFLREYVICPTTPDAWKEVEREFRVRWHVPHASGALDGKHIAIKKPKNSGTLYHNYKGFFSVVMLALVDGEYKFRWLDIRTEGSCSDAQIFNCSQLREMIEDETLGLPQACPIVQGQRNVNYFIVADDAFALKKWLLKPYSRRGLSRQERIANYRISRARRVVENAFGILAARFRVLLTTIELPPETVKDLVMTCAVLHNILRSPYQNHGAQQPGDGEDPDFGGVELVGGGANHGAERNPSREAKRQRDYMKQYFNNAGAVPWQDDRIW